MAFKSKLKTSEEIPTASLADIAFLLIIFFMVTTTFAASRGLDFQLPRQQKITGDEEVANIEAILIEVDDSGRILLDRNPANLEDIQPYIAPKLAINPSKPVLIKISDEAEYGRFIDVLDELKQADVKNIVLPSKEEIESWGDLY